MLARLVVTRGLPQSKVVHLTSEELTIGRDPGNQIAILQPLVSRRHCSVRRAGEEGEYSYLLTDLASSNGTFVNGQRVNEHRLAAGDQIGVGEATLVFLVDATEPGPVPVDPVPLPTDATVQFSPDQILHMLGASRKEQEREVLFSLARSLPLAQTPGELEQHLLEAVLQAVPGERGAVLRFSADGQATSCATARDLAGWRAQPFPVSRSILKQLTQRTAVLYTDLQARCELTSESLMALPVNAILAVPLLLPDRLIGAIYVDTAEPGQPFDSGHLELMAAVGALAAPALAASCQREELLRENARLREVSVRHHNMVGSSAVMREISRQIARVASSEARVLIYGESGTGKELAARAIHAGSRRSHQPFIAVNCGALNPELSGSELFGHEKGAFTGAHAQHKGVLEAASGGTLLLDEIGDLRPEIQTKLLRVLQEQVYQRIGSTELLTCDVRVLAATHRDLAELVRERQFREDLYFRLKVVTIVMPALRERSEDLPDLAYWFMRRHAMTVDRPVQGIAPGALELLQRYHWPGNVRELSNVVERAMVMGSEPLLQAEDFGLSIAGEIAKGGPSHFYQALDETRRKLLKDALARTNGNIAATARLLGLNRTHLHRMARELGLLNGDEK